MGRVSLHHRQIVDDKALINKEINLLYVMEVFSGLARGSYLVCIGWTTLIISNNVATVGQIFVVASLTYILAGPFIGIVIDRYKRRKLIVLAQLSIAASMLCMGGLIFYTRDVSVAWLFATVISVSCFRLMYRGAFNGIIRASVDDKDILATLARANFIHLFSTAAGTAAIGFIIQSFSPAHAFAISAIASLFLLAVAKFLADGMVKTNSRGFHGFWSDFKSGLVIFKNNKLIQMLTLLSVVALPVGQLSNSLLSSFIRDDLGRGSDLFGIVDAAWPIGGMLAAALLSSKLKALNIKDGEYALAILAGAATLVLSQCTESFCLSLAHGFMGFFVWLCRIVIGGRVLELCDSENVGRTTVYKESMTAVAAMVMSLSPSVIRLEATALYFSYWGLFVAVSAGLLWGWKIKTT